MGYYEPQWSVEEQTMVDMMVLNGYGVTPIINRDYTLIQLFPPDGTAFQFKADTEYEAVRKAFDFWTKNNG